MADVFAFVSLKPCGCVAQAATPQALGDMMRNKFFRSEMQAGRIKTVQSREEWLAMPWTCEQCKPQPKKAKTASLFTTTEANP